MKKNKILRMLSVTIALTLFGNIVTFATKNNKKHIQNRNKLETQNKTFLEKEAIDGLNFKKVMKDHSFNQKNNIHTICNNNIWDYGIEFNFICPLTSDDGVFHLIEHIMDKIIRKITNLDKKTWAGFDEEHLSYVSAFTGGYGGMICRNCKVMFNFKDKFLKDEKGAENEKIYKAISDVLLGLKTIDEKELKEIFEAEKNRMFLERERKYSAKKSLDETDINMLEYKKTRGIYDYVGEFDKIKDISFKKVKEYIKKYIINSKPYVVVRCKTEEEAKKRVSLLNKYYFKNKKNSNIPEEGKLKLEDKTFIEKTATDRENDIFIIYDNNNNECVKKHIFEIEYDIENLNIEEKMALSLLKEDYFRNIIDFKSLGYDNFITFVFDTKKLIIRIHGDNKKLFTKEKAKEIIQKIKEKIIEKLEKEKIEKKDLDIEKLKCINPDSYEQSIENINNSILKYKTPFSDKYFFIDKKTGKLKNKEEAISIIKNCAEKNLGDILKNIIKTTPKVLHLINPKNDNKKNNNLNKKDEILKDLPNLTNLPYTINLKNVKDDVHVKFPIAEEKVSKEIIKNEIHNKGLTYGYVIARKSLDTYPDLEGLSKTEEKNIKEFFKSGNFEKKLKNLKVTDQELKDLKEKYIKIANKNIEQLKNNKKLQEESLKVLEVEYKKESENKFQKILDIVHKMNLEEVKYLLQKYFVYLVLNKKEYEKYKNLSSKISNMDEFKREKFKFNPKDKKTKFKKEDLKKLFNLVIEISKDLINFEDEMLKKFETNKKDLNNLTKEMVNDVLKNYIVKDFNEVNSKKIEKDKTKKYDLKN